MTRKMRAWAAMGLVLIALVAWRFNRIEVDVLGLLPTDLPSAQGLRLVQKHFQDSREVQIVLSHEEADLAAEAAQSLGERLRKNVAVVESAAWAPVWQEHPEELAELAAFRWLNAPPSEVAALVQRLRPDALERSLRMSMETLTTSLSPAEMARAGYDPLQLAQGPATGEANTPSGESAHASPDGRLRIVRVRSKAALADYNQCDAFWNVLRGEVAGWRTAFPEFAALRVRYTGSPVFVSEIASGMRRDLVSSVGGTAGVIALLFWLAHRRWGPMLRLIGLMALTMVLTWAAGVVLLGTLNVISLGFAAILAGLVVDYGLVLHQQALQGGTVAETRRVVGPGILWGAITTAAAFLCLNLSGLPGLGALGTLVGVGVLIGAAVMLGLFPKETLRDDDVRGEVFGGSVGGTPSGATGTVALPGSKALFWLSTAMLAVLLATLFWKGGPPLDASTNSLRPAVSEAYATLDEVRTRTQGPEGEPVVIVCRGKDDAAVRDQFEKLALLLNKARQQGEVASYRLPLELWPDTGGPRNPRTELAALAARQEELERRVLEAGFSKAATRFLGSVLATWRSAAQREGSFVPSGNTSRAVFSSFRHEDLDGVVGLGWVRPGRVVGTLRESSWVKAISAIPGCHATGWVLLGQDLAAMVVREVWRVAVPVLLCVLISLALTFRAWFEWFLSLVVLLSSLAALLGVMQIADWSWNLINIMAMPLLLGAGVDYSIHMQLALRESGGDLARVRRVMGKAVWLCAGTTVAGFGSLAWSGNLGLASLGKVSATAIFCCAVVSTLLLPVWWLKWKGATRHGEHQLSPPGFYSMIGWAGGMALSRWFPRAVLVSLARSGCAIHRLIHRSRFAVVRANLSPVFAGDAIQAERAAKELYGNFGEKLVDLLRYEAGVAESPIVEWTGVESFERAVSQGRGVLLVTLHLGNWEIGASLLASRGSPVWVVTAPEPDPRLTQRRAALRARRGVQTLVLGGGDFGFVSLIGKLREGACVAMLLDRPGEKGAMESPCFGRSLRVSPAPALLAQATGCCVVPTAIVRTGHGYAVHVLDPLACDGESLETRAGRQRWTNALARSFEPWIRKYNTQWYHFVPIWKP